MTSSASAKSTSPGPDERMEEVLEKVNRGVRYFKGHRDEAVEYISTELDYSAEDAREWLETVRFAEDVRGMRGSVVQETVNVLKKAGVLGEEVEVKGMVGIRRSDLRIWNEDGQDFHQ